MARRTFPSTSLRAAKSRAASRRPAARRRALGHFWPAGCAAALLVWLCAAGPSSAAPPVVTPRTAVIVDALSAIDPNPAFARAARSLLEAHGYSVAYYDAAAANLSAFASLPALRPGVLLLRTHAAIDGAGQVGLFTDVPFNATRHAAGFQQGILGPAAPTLEDLRSEDERVVAVRPRLVEAWTTDLPGSLVVAMGCDTLETRSMADAFLARGARAFVGWTGQVDGRRSDDTALGLLSHLLDGDGSVKEAVRDAAADLGPGEGVLGWAGHGGMTLPDADEEPAAAGPAGEWTSEASRQGLGRRATA